MGQRKTKEVQLSLFEPVESNEASPVPEVREPTMMDLLKDRFENTEMNQEDYRKWIRFLVNSSFKRMG